MLYTENMNKKIIISAIVILIILGVFIFFKSQRTAPVTVMPIPQVSSEGFALADVAKHANASSCWTAVAGQVYDMTTWIAEHPGGESAILGMCGKDGTQDFMDQHGGQGKPERELGKYAIGILK